ncbi:MAG: VCBS repeat-containing protein, partial [Chloroflexi bacterium]|nr:VCBS repeat-containing protein [Chloroflexota bacterium]
LWNRGGGRFEAAPLVEHAFQQSETGLIADLNGDGLPDLASARARGDLAIYFGNAEGRFPEPPRIVSFDYPLRAPSVLSAGDIDADGDLDLWLAQYKPAYLEGQMPTPFYDANDGYPAYLLRNDGQGDFRDVTEQAGLAPKRHRRTYTSSFVDLDEDGDLDLLVVSDYAGIDLYLNDGSGRFRDQSDALEADRHLFGMSASFADYDLDGRLDFFVAGMASTTARRLEALGLGRDDRPEIQAMRMRMAFGNRMYLANGAGWREPEFAAEVARTGWTWGTTALDFDNDGDPDLFAANGHESGNTTDDYCSTFWTHDIYDGASEPDPGLGELFQESIQRFFEGKLSWDGYQKNRLLMNRSGRGFVEVGFPMGVADEFDGRSAVSEDLDRDGRVDLVLVEDHGVKGQRLHVYRNRLETGNA